MFGLTDSGKGNSNGSSSSYRRDNNDGRRPPRGGFGGPRGFRSAPSSPPACFGGG